MDERLCRGSRGSVEADFGSFSLGCSRDFEKLARLEAEHSGEDVGGELLNLGIEVADDGVVVAASVLHVVLNFGERVLQRSEAFDGAKLRIGFSERKQAL